jgi:hypothetical protein
MVSSAQHRLRLTPEPPQSTHETAMKHPQVEVQHLKALKNFKVL